MNKVHCAGHHQLVKLPITFISSKRNNFISLKDFRYIKNLTYLSKTILLFQLEVGKWHRANVWLLKVQGKSNRWGEIDNSFNPRHQTNSNPPTSGLHSRFTKVTPSISTVDIVGYGSKRFHVKSIKLSLHCSFI